MRKAIRPFILLLALCVTAAHLPAQAVNPKLARPLDRETVKERLERKLKDRYIVVYKDKCLARKSMADNVRLKGGKVHNQFNRLRGASVQLTPKQRKALAADPDAEYIEQDYPLFLAELPGGSPVSPPSDPQHGGQWALENSGQTGGTIGVDIDAHGAWNLTTWSPDVVVAVIDAGVNYHHPEQSSPQALEERWA